MNQYPNKKFIIDVGHPAQVHNFKYVYRELVDRGWEGFVTLKDKEVALKLMDFYGIPYKRLFKNSRNGLVNKFIALRNTFRFIRYCISFNPAMVISRNSIHSSLATKLLGIKHIALSDTESALNLSQWVDVALTGEGFRLDFGRNHIRARFNIELFYLHPKRYTFNEETWDLLGMQPGEKFTLLRFVSWDAHHDVGLSGMTLENKIKAVKAFRKLGKVLISSESRLPDELEKYKYKVSPERIHDVMAAASLVFGESATMASEAAMLGTPAVFLDEEGRGYTDEEEEFGLVYSFKTSLEEQEKAIEQGEELLQIDKADFREKLNIFLADKIDPPAFLAWMVDEFPESVKIMRENPDYQEKFK